MHELSIATSILDAVEREGKLHPEASFKAVGLRIGEVSGVDIDSLTFGWEAITKDTEWESLKLVIESVPRKNRCTQCGNEFAVRDYEIECPACHSLATVNLSGDELDIAYIEAEELEGAEA
ncbi:MAG TPA: hydrogenase maturation nickel metallochaperone HypA [Terriglobales bacterium]|nr:hydrogenase maturation nickel metallochaperone HypA [Terriglobales bacterium]